MKKKLDIANIRAELGITQAKLAELLDVDRKYVSMIETGTKPLSTKLSKKLDALISGSIHAPGATVTGGIIGHNGTVTHPPTADPATLHAELQSMRQSIEGIALDLALIKKLLTK